MALGPESQHPGARGRGGREGALDGGGKNGPGWVRAGVGGVLRRTGVPAEAPAALGGAACPWALSPSCEKEPQEGPRASCASPVGPRAGLRPSRLAQP